MSHRRTATRFAIVGVLNTALDVGLFLLLHPHLGLVLANLVSVSCGMACSFVLNGRYTFGAGRLTWAQAWRFVLATGTAMWVLQPLVIAALVDPLPLAAAKLGGVAVGIAANYLAYRYLVWPSAEHGAERGVQHGPVRTSG